MQTVYNVLFLKYVYNIRPVRLPTENEMRSLTVNDIGGKLTTGSERLTSTSCRMPPATMETKTSTCGDEDSRQHHSGSRCAGHMSSCAAKQVSAWIRSINPTPRLWMRNPCWIVCLYPWSGAAGPCGGVCVCVMASHSQSVCVFLRAPEDVLCPPNGASSDLLSPPFCLFSPPNAPRHLRLRWRHADSKLLTTNRMRSCPYVCVTHVDIILFPGSMM